MPVAAAPAPVTTCTRYAILGDFPMQPARPRRGRRSSAKSAAPVNAYGREILEFGGGIGELPSQSSSTAGHGGDVDGSTRTLHAHARTETEIDDDEDDENMCGLFSGAELPGLPLQRPKSRRKVIEEKREREEALTCCVSIGGLTRQIANVSVGTVAEQAKQSTVGTVVEKQSKHG